MNIHASRRCLRSFFGNARRSKVSRRVSLLYISIHGNAIFPDDGKSNGRVLGLYVSVDRSREQQNLVTFKRACFSAARVFAASVNRR